MLKKILFNLNILIILFFFSFSYNVHAASIKYKVADAAVDKLVDETIYSVAKQTGYKIATQEQVDSMRASFKKQFPDWDFTTAGDINYDDYPNIAKYDRESKEVIVKLDDKMRSWVNTYITGLPQVETLENQTTDVEKNQTYKLSGGTAYCDISAHSDVSHFYYKGYDYPKTAVYYKLSYDYSESSTGYKSSSINVFFYDSSFQIVYTKTLIAISQSVITSDYPSLDSYSPHIIEYDSNGKLSSITHYQTIDHTADFTNFVPYPTKQTELTDTTKLPMELHVPATVDSDNVITPSVSPLPFPSTTDAPDTDGKVKVGDSTIVYQKPTVDPSSGTIINPQPSTGTNPDTGTNPNTGTNPDTGSNTSPLNSIPTPNSENDIPQLDFKPLYVGLQDKFPFCVPFDFINMVRNWIVPQEAPHFHVVFDPTYFKGGGEFDFDFSKVDKIRLVFRYFLLLVFVYYLISKSRSWIGNGGAS